MHKYILKNKGTVVGELSSGLQAPISKPEPSQRQAAYE